MRFLFVAISFSISTVSISQDLSGWYTMEDSHGRIFLFQLEKSESKCTACYHFYQPEKKHPHPALIPYPEYEQTVMLNGNKLKYSGEITLKIKNGTIYQGVVNARKVEINKLESLLEAHLHPKNLRVESNRTVKGKLRIRNKLDIEQKLRIWIEGATIKKSYFQLEDKYAEKKRWKQFGKKFSATIRIPKNADLTYEIELLGDYKADFGKQHQFVLKVENQENFEGYYVLTDTMNVEYDFSQQLKTEPYFTDEQRAIIDSNRDLSYVDRLNELSNGLRSSVRVRFRENLETDDQFFFRNMDRGMKNIDTTLVDRQLQLYFYGLIHYSIQRIDARANRRAWLQNAGLIKLVAPSLFSNKPSDYEDIETGANYRVGQTAATVNRSIQDFGTSYAKEMASGSQKDYEELNRLMEKWTDEFNRYRTRKYDQRWNTIFDKLSKAILSESFTGNGSYDLEYLSPKNPVQLDTKSAHQIHKIALGVKYDANTDWIEHAIFIKNNEKKIVVLKSENGPAKFVLFKARLTQDYLDNYQGNFDPLVLRKKSMVNIFNNIAVLEKTNDEEYYILYQRCNCPAGIVSLNTHPYPFRSNLEDDYELPNKQEIASFFSKNPANLNFNAIRTTLLEKSNLKKEITIDSEIFDKNWEILFRTTNKLSDNNLYTMKWDKNIRSFVFALAGNEKLTFSKFISHSIMGKSLRLPIENNDASDYMIRKVADRLYFFENNSFVGGLVLSEIATNSSDITISRNSTIENFRFQILATD
ncbi:MAG: hypothetical protein AAF600_09670 [Bacteroidota bacterium]